MKVFEIITQLIEVKKKEKRIPHCAMLKDVRELCLDLTDEEFRGELSRLKKDGKVAFKETLNSFSIHLGNK